MRYLRVFDATATRSTCSIARCVTPWSVLVPSIVYVFPLLVCPYAKTVPLNPPRALSTTGAAMAVYTSSFVAPGSNTESKAKESGSREAPTVSVRSTQFGETRHACAKSGAHFSRSLSGRTRTPTTILSIAAAKDADAHTGCGCRRRGCGGAARDSAAGGRYERRTGGNSMGVNLGAQGAAGKGRPKGSGGSESRSVPSEENDRDSVRQGTRVAREECGSGTCGCGSSASAGAQSLTHGANRIGLPLKLAFCNMCIAGPLLILAASAIFPLFI